MLPPAGRAAPPLPTACLPKHYYILGGGVIKSRRRVNMVLNLTVIIVFPLLCFWDERLRVVFHVCLCQCCLVVECPSFTLHPVMFWSVPLTWEIGAEDEDLFCLPWLSWGLTLSLYLFIPWRFVRPPSPTPSLRSYLMETFTLWEPWHVSPKVPSFSTDPRALAKICSLQDLPLCLLVSGPPCPPPSLPPPTSCDSGLVFSVCKLVGKH